jgi:hypothetical protein
MNAGSRKQVETDATITVKKQINRVHMTGQRESLVSETGNGTPELPSAWGYSWATLSPGVINTER